MPATTLQPKRTTKTTVVSRIGQRRQVVIPKEVFDALNLAEGDFLEVTAQNGCVAMKRKRLDDASNTLTPAEALQGPPCGKTAQSRQDPPVVLSQT